MTPRKNVDENTLAWFARNWKWLAACSPVFLFMVDNVVGPALSGKAAQRAISAAVRPIVQEAVQGAKADMDTLKYDVRQGFSRQDQRLARIEKALIRLPNGKKVLRDIRREEREREDLFGEMAVPPDVARMNWDPPVGGR